jgi:hypothetical protein
MRRARIFLIIGIWVAILPYLGFPYSWKDVLFALTGLVIIFISYLMYEENKPKDVKGKFDNFRENADFNEEVPRGEIEVAVIEETEDGQVRTEREV